MRRASLRAMGVAATLVILGAALAVGCTSSPPGAGDARQALRVLRLAGFEDAAVGADGRVAYARVGLPVSASSADAELSWQTALAALTVAYPRSPRYTVAVGDPESGAIELTVDGEKARAAVDAGDADALRRAAEFETAPEVPPVAVAELVDVVESVDAENRSVGFVTARGLSIADAVELADEWRAARDNAPGVPAPTGGAQEAARAAATRIAKALDAAKLNDPETLADDVRALVEEGAVAKLRVLAASVEAAGAKRPLGSVLIKTAAVARVVRDGPAGKTASGAEDTVQAVTGLSREPSLDVTGTPTGDAVPDEVLARVGVAQADGTFAVGWRESDGTPRLVAPARWIAYRASDGTVYWLAGENGTAALVDRSVPGWAWQRRRAELVDANDVSRTLLTVLLG